MMPGLATVRKIMRVARHHREAARAATGKGFVRQFVELLHARTRGFTPDDYYILPLYRGEKWHMMGQQHYSRLNAHLNPQYSGVVPFNKWVSAHFFAAANLAAPAIHGFFHPQRGVDRAGGALKTADALDALLRRCGHNIVIKPIDGGHGRNVVVFSACDVDAGTLTKSNGQTMALDALHALLASEDEGWLIQDRVEQHPALARLHPSSLNTLRVITLALDDGTVTTTLAYLRMGRGGEAKDNATSGGIAAWVDVATGRCEAAVESHSEDRFATHPDTGEAIDGATVPLWPEVRALAERAHALLPFPRDLGWDIGVTPDGPVLIEVNSYWPSHVFQKPDHSLHDLPYGALLAELDR